MANPNPKPPPVHSRFKKGQVANPEGGRAHDKETKMIRNLTRKELAEVGSLVVKKDLESLKAMRTNPKSTVLQAMMAGMAIKIVSRGDAAAFDALLNRLVGKVKDEVITTNQNVNMNIQAEDREELKDIMRELDDEV